MEIFHSEVKDGQGKMLKTWRFSFLLLIEEGIEKEAGSGSNQLAKKLLVLGLGF